eukprot:1010979-Pelagomonas_calceolata.AAC.1
MFYKKNSGAELDVKVNNELKLSARKIGCLAFNCEPNTSYDKGSISTGLRDHLGTRSVVVPLREKWYDHTMQNGPPLIRTA